jgi:hypothetical protein
MKHLQSAPFYFALLFGLSACLTGCSMGSFEPTSSFTSDSTAEMAGIIKGGQQPIVGATVTMYETNTNGAVPASVTNGSIVVAHALAVTNSEGAFSFGTLLTCTPGAQLWIESAGGDPVDGFTGTTNHPAVLQAAALGPCPALLPLVPVNIGATYPFVLIDEVSSVAFAYTAGPWYTGTALTSAWPQTTAGKLGVTQAFATARSLYNIAGGTGLGLANTTTANGNGTVPQATIHTIANIASACINSAVGSAACSTLFGATGGTTATTNTLQALVYMARHIGGVPVATVFPLQPTTPQFFPNLPTAPTSFALEVLYTGGGLHSPGGIAIDSVNSMWIANDNVAGIAEFTNLGVVQSTLPNGYTASSLTSGALTSMALGNDGFLYAATQGNNCFTVLSPFGSAQSGAPCNTAISSAAGVTAGSQHIWIADGNVNELSEITESSYTATISGNGLNYPDAVAVDDSQNVWVANRLGNTYSKFTSAGVAVSTGGSGFNTPAAVALDKSSNAWFANNGNSNIVELNSAGTPVAGSPFACGAGNATGIAVDGDGNVFTMGNTSISELTAGGVCEFQSVPAVGTGGTSGILNVQSGLAIDGSGNIWFTNFTANQVAEIIGMAAPVVTPLASTNALGTRP